MSNIFNNNAIKTGSGDGSAYVINDVQTLQIGDQNTQNTINYFKDLKNKIESSDAPEKEKEEARSSLLKALNLPLVSSILGEAAGAVIGFFHPGA